MLHMSKDVEEIKEKRAKAVENLEKAIKMVMGQLTNEDLPMQEKKYWTNTLAYLSAVLNNLLKEVEKTKEPEEDEGQDLATILSGLEKEAKLHIKDQRGRKRGKQFEKAEPEDAGVELVLAVCDAISMCHKILANEKCAIVVRIECARLLPSLIQAVRLLAGPEPVAEGIVS